MISRQMSLLVTIQSKQDLLDYLSVAYAGNVTDLFWNRLHIKIREEHSKLSIKDCVDFYFEEINNNIKNLKQDYIHYLKNLSLNNDVGIVDIGYYGTIQQRLNQILDCNIKGFYFNANFEKSSQDMYACFQHSEDKSAKKSKIREKEFFFESLLTAPYGMLQFMKDNKFIFAENKRNQEYFEYKVQINNGIQSFIKDYLEKFERLNLKLDTEFVDQYFGLCMEGGVEFSKNVKETFWMDSAFMHDEEYNLFF